MPRGIQNIAESSVDFVREGIIMQTIGPDGMRYLPFLPTMFFFIFFINIFEILPFIQFPGNARMAVPFILALLVWFIYNIVGIMKQGPLAYLKNSTIPPGVPKADLRPRRSHRVHLDRSSSGRSRWPSGSSPTCSPGTSSS